MLKQEVIHAILQEIDRLLKKEVFPVSNDHIEHLGTHSDTLEYLIEMKNQGLISGDVVTRSADGTAHRMTNIRLTYLGIRTLRQ
jgi:hypothetical protein